MAEVILILGLAVVLAWPLGHYLARVLKGETSRADVVFAPVESMIYGFLRVDPQRVLSTTFEAGHSELVLVRDIEVMSSCEHHLLPFHGVAHVGYIPGPDGRITGLSKLARLVEVYARRPQVQERLTSQIADTLMGTLQPRGVIVVIDCEHMCMAVRGIRKPGARTITSAVRGILQHDARTRAEAMSLILGR